MIEKQIDIQTADGRMDSFVTHPDEGGPFPAVIVLMDIWGLREELFDVAPQDRRRRLSRHGAELLLPPRQGAVRIPRRRTAGCARSTSCRKEMQDEMHANRSLLNGRMAMADIGAVLKFLERRAGAEGPERHHRLLPRRLAVARGGGGISRAVPRLGQPAWHAAGQRACPTRRISSSQACAARSIAASPRRTSLHRRPPSRRWAGCLQAAAQCALPLQRPPRHRARLRTAGSRHLRQGRRQPRLGEHLRDVQAAVGL